MSQQWVFECTAHYQGRQRSQHLAQAVSNGAQVDAAIALPRTPRYLPVRAAHAAAPRAQRISVCLNTPQSKYCSGLPASPVHPLLYTNPAQEAQKGILDAKSCMHAVIRCRLVLYMPLTTEHTQNYLTNPFKPCARTCSMACRAAMWPRCAARCSGLNPRLRP